MNWFIAKLVFAIHHHPNAISTQFDEQFRLVLAKDTLEALLKSRMLGIKEEHSFTNENAIEVSWDFIDVIDLSLIESFTDGMELNARIFEQDSNDLYIDYVKHRGQALINDIEKSSLQVVV
jgi:hypothetical protein